MFGGDYFALRKRGKVLKRLITATLLSNISMSEYTADGVTCE